MSVTTCELCGEPMPAGETMFKYHGYSGPCPKPPKERKPGLTAEAERDRANFLLRNCERTLQMCWRDLRDWVQFGRYNAEGIIANEPGPLPEPPQRPTVAGVNKTEQNLTVVEETLGWIHKHLETVTPVQTT